MNTLKRIWLFLLVMFVVPLLIIIGIGFCTQQSEGFIYSILISIATSLIAAGVVYWFIDNRLNDLIKTNDEITVVLKSPNRKNIKCPPMSRKDFCRSEIMGYIGMVTGGPNFKMDRERFIIIGKQICETQKTKGNQEFIVDCTDAEMEQFGAE
ncbi:hypothetical protein CCZ37_07205 [Vibrio qinghaiensis]|uniref:Uncharacterized protein n=1 Tax=Vibrio qinghaiensis TaxID=2025808 RepID=A0A223MXU4_9VIBR|nr:hypothetical protein [Vibrio qinghaiensis]ASU22390.1 hypothetical protein CCZ37_07205 [Vibrio qinghaiensis]